MKIEIINFGAVENGRLPKRAYPADCGADIYSTRHQVIAPGETACIPLDFGVKIPNGLAGFIYPRSSLAKRGVFCQLPPIDSEYTGPINAVVYNSSHEDFIIEEGDRIGQLVVMPCILADFVTEPPEKRGAGCFGSTGK